MVGGRGSCRRAHDVTSALDSRAVRRGSPTYRALGTAAAYHSRKATAHRARSTPMRRPARHRPPRHRSPRPCRSLGQTGRVRPQCGARPRRAPGLRRAATQSEMRGLPPEARAAATSWFGCRRPSEDRRLSHRGRCSVRRYPRCARAGSAVLRWSVERGTPASGGRPRRSQEAWCREPCRR